jgi:carboxyl-terminal processing protease
VRRSWTLAKIMLVVAVLIVGTVRPAGAQIPNGQQLFSQVFRLIGERALAPPPYPVLLRAAVSGMQRVLRTHGVASTVGEIAITGNDQQDLQATLTRLQQAIALLPPGVPPIEVAYGAIRAMVEAVGDRYTSFLLPPEMARFMEQLQSEPQSFVGIGVLLTEQEGRVVIVGVVEDSPAAQAGIRPDDIIVSVNGQPTQGRTLAEVRQMIAGEEGSVVTLGLFRPSTGQTLTVPMTRARIVQATVTARMVAPNIGYLRLSLFRSGSADLVASALRQLQEEGARGLVLDLRSNPGGLLHESIDIASHFLQEGIIVTDRGARNRSTTYVVRPREPKFLANVAVLVNRTSASASEIVAGALQDAGVKLIGDRTFGKASVQTVHEFADGSGLFLTTARYLTRSGRDISDQGLTPDIPVALGSAAPGTPDDAQLQRAVAVVTDLLRGATTAGAAIR